MKAFLLVAGVLLCLNQISTGQNTTTSQTIIPLSMVRDNGMLDAMSSGRAFANKLFTDYERNPQNRGPPKTMVYKGSATWVASNKLAEVERSQVAVMLQHAGCDPYDQVVTLANSRPDVVMYPSCVMAKQCGGCCGHPALACRPTSVKDKLVQVAKYVYDGTSMYPEETIDWVTVKEHERCECMCKVQESDCNPALHTFDAVECQCKCKNNHLRSSCPDNKRWNDDICACQCAKTENCGTGYTFNVNTCLCDEMTERSSGGLTNIGRPQPPPSRPSAPDSQPSECGHVRCPRRYIAKLKFGGRCGCVFDRNSL